MAIPTIYDDQETTPRLTPGVRALALVAAAVVFLQWTVVTEQDVLAALAFQDGSVASSVWRAVSYGFVHVSALHLMLTLYALLAFGPRLEEAMGTRAFVLYHLWCGLGGAVAYLLFSRTGLLVGGSAAALGVMYGYWQQWPRDEMALFGVLPMRAGTLALLLGAAMLASGSAALGGVPGTDGVTYLSHLGGFALGWLYFRTPPAASLDRLRQRISPAPDYPDDVPPRAIPRTMPRTRERRDETDEIVAKSKAVASPAPRPTPRAVVTPVRTAREARAAELDRVLDKISQDGLESLSHDERAVLDEMARRLRAES